MEFLLVRFPQFRDVLADGAAIGDTNTTLMLPAGEYVITLSGDGYTPDEQDIVLNGTSSNDPLVIAFTLAEVSVPVRRSRTKPKTKPKPRPKAKSRSAAKKPKVKASARGKRKSKCKRKSR